MRKAVQESSFEVAYQKWRTLAEDAALLHARYAWYLAEGECDSAKAPNFSCIAAPCRQPLPDDVS